MITPAFIRKRYKMKEVMNIRVLIFLRPCRVQYYSDCLHKDGDF